MLSLRSIGNIGRTYRHVNRYRQILAILFRYGFDNIIDILNIDQYLEIGLQMISRKKREKFERLTQPERVRMIFEELGPTFIKFGQILSTRPDLIPLPYIHELEKLQDDVPPFEFLKVKEIIESEFKIEYDSFHAGTKSIDYNEDDEPDESADGSVDKSEDNNHQQDAVDCTCADADFSSSTNISGPAPEHGPDLNDKKNLDDKKKDAVSCGWCCFPFKGNPFESIEETPIASASIGQVHRALLHSGERVAVKIQRPGIRKLVEVDLEILHHLAILMERHIEDLSFLKPVKIVQEFAATLEKELDYTLEASNMQRVARQFMFDTDIYIPKVYLDQTTSSILTMEYIDGIKISEVERLDAEGYDRKMITERGADFILTQVLEHGFFHGDLHPGNIFVLPGNVICPIDFGIMGYVDQYSREVFVDMIANTVMQNIPQVSRLLLEMTDYDDEPDLRALEKDISGFIGHYLAGMALKDINMGRMLQDIVQIAINHRLRLFPETFLMLRSFTAVEGVAEMVYPGFDMVSHAAPYIKKAKAARLSPSRISEDLGRVSSESLKLLQSIPKESLSIIRQLRKGKLVLGFDLQHLDRLISAHRQAGSRIALSIVVAALLLSSALLLSFNVAPKIFGLSLLGVAGLASAGFVGFMLVVSIFRQ